MNLKQKLAKLKTLRQTHTIEELVEELAILNITIEDLEAIYDMVAR